MLAFKPSLQAAVFAFFGAVVAAALLILLPCLRRNRIAAFFFAVMVLAAIAESCLLPVSKNLGFVAVGTYGLMASFIAGWVTRSRQSRETLSYRIAVWTACVLLLLVHVPGAIAARIATVKAVAFIFGPANQRPRNWQNSENARVVFVNAPWPAAMMYMPSIQALHNLPLPKTMRALVPACTSFDLQRTDDKTLVIQSHGRNIFSSDAVGPMHLANALSTINRILAEPRCSKGDRYRVNGLTVEVLESDAADLPSRVAFRFDTSLDSPDFHWLQFDWETFSQEPFTLPAIGQGITLSGPAG